MARAITLVENRDPLAYELVPRALAAPRGRAVMVGLTGPPGRRQVDPDERPRRATCGASELRVAVVAVDPSSPFTHGALLGDRIRMADHDPRRGRLHPLDERSRPRRTGSTEATICAARARRRRLRRRWFCETVGVGPVRGRSRPRSSTPSCSPCSRARATRCRRSRPGLMEIPDVVLHEQARPPGRERRCASTCAGAPLDAPRRAPPSRSSRPRRSGRRASPSSGRRCSTTAPISSRTAASRRAGARASSTRSSRSPSPRPGGG